MRVIIHLHPNFSGDQGHKNGIASKENVITYPFYGYSIYISNT